MVDGHGGRRPGAGRKPGSTTAKTREIADKALENGLTPLEYMLSVLRDDGLDHEVRMDAAKAAAPFIHPRLAAVEHSGEMTFKHEDALSDLE
ncbi:hypothetical protein [Inquilinus limosus]|uniref:Uncharacterized protein n=1 Tax=Inquilinus limosus TaxID=171674 RepID=A0A211ZQR5_9PROT|nr:hypothetical protein [Inquilinus limosus]OWJ67437.1 hypothetical protein BWR60_09530 [Inquilinus limosus]